MTLAIATWFAFVISAGVALVVVGSNAASRKERTHIGAVDEAMKEVRQLFLALSGTLTLSLMGGAHPEAPKEASRPVAAASRVYAAILTRGAETRLYMGTAPTVEEFITNGKALVGEDWKAAVIEHVDILPPAAPAPTVAHKKRQGIADFISSLKLVEDVYCETPTEKRTLGRVITRLEEQKSSLT